MNIETMKSVILVILIAFSLVLSVALWNYQPETETVDDDGLIEDTQLDEDIGGEQTIPGLVIPDQVVFHEEGTSYSFKDSDDEWSFFQQIQEWELSAMDLNPDPINFENHENAVEVIFPTTIPLQTVGDLFMADRELLGNTTQSFDRMFLVHHANDQPPTSYELWFVDSEGDGNIAKLQATISASAGERALSVLSNKDELQEQVRVADAFGNEETEGMGAQHIYLPKEEVSIPRVVLQQTESIPVTPLRNDLFPSPDLVSIYNTNSGARRAKTAERQLDAIDERRMEYVVMIPNSANSSNLGSYELLTKSVEDVNSHLGWTNDFRLNELLSYQNLNQVQYRMYHNDLPIMENQDTTGLANILLSYEQGEIQTYNRPLIKFESVNEQVLGNIPSGEEVLEDLQQSGNYDLEDIQGLEIRYKLEEQNNRLVFNLIPKWYIQTSTGSWNELYGENLTMQNEEVS
ncbi:YycH family regulatory protein [Halobacillus litoralis]|uniref:YycH family regulatory protein n=1 Tax=Halobacillus litoralis TaxID=45668 RepID=UPI00248F6159|nr:two-component system activity regulator YycH [Halobacillus litoralis]